MRRHFAIPRSFSSVVSEISRPFGSFPNAGGLLVIGILCCVGGPRRGVFGNEPRREMVAMRDGTELATDVYLPDGEGPWPCILSRTPYNKEGIRKQAGGFSEKGFAVVAQDCRGRFGSNGEYDPFKTDHLDGYDTIEWIAAQSWCDGNVGMYGGSALGITSHLAATQSPPHLRCAYVIVASASARRQTVYQGGVYRKELNDGWLSVMGASDAITESLAHPPADPYWDWREITDFHDTMRIPVYEIGGWFDIFAQGTLDNFVGLQANGSGAAAGNQKLVMGPWAHGALGGRLQFPDDRAGEVLGLQEPLRWFGRWLKGKRNGIASEAPVRYYLMGDPGDPEAAGNEWIEATSWPPPSRPTSWFLHGGGELRRSLPETLGTASRYAYDPDKPVPTAGGANLILGGKGPIDQRSIGEREDYLRFVSPPLDRPLEIVGPVFVDLFVSSDSPDTDFTAKLVDVYPDGYEALIVDGIMQSRYREGLDREVFLEAERIVPLRIDLWSTALVFNQGHRIAVHVSSSNDPRFEPNPNTGARPRQNDEKRVARNAIHHDVQHPSRLLLPVVRWHPARKSDESTKDDNDGKSDDLPQREF